MQSNFAAHRQKRCDTIEFRPLTIDDIPAWSQLLALAFERTPGQMEQLVRWFHDGFTLVTCGAWDGSTLVAQYNCRLTQVWLPGQSDPIPVGMGLNMAVHPDYRGQGLLDKVSRPVHDQISAQGVVAGVGFSNAGGVDVTRKSKNYAYEVMGNMRSVAVLFSRLRYPQALTLTHEWPEKPLAVPRFDDQFIEYVATPGSIRHRFHQHPFRTYQLAIAEETDRISGIVVYRPLQVKGMKGVGLLAAYGENLPELLARWAGTMRRAGFLFAHVLVSPRSPFLEHFQHMGRAFALPYSHEPYYLIARKLQADTPDVLFNLAAWNCLGGDIL